MQDKVRHFNFSLDRLMQDKKPSEAIGQLRDLLDNIELALKEKNLWDEGLITEVDITPAQNGFQAKFHGKVVCNAE